MSKPKPVNRREFLALSASAAGLGLQRQRRPNILLVVADDLGYSDLGCYGGEIATPTLDALAASGLRFAQFYTTARCCPSRASILTGQYPHRVGVGHMVTDMGHPGYRGRLSDNAVTLAEVLKLADYRTFMSGKWHVGTNDPTRHGFEQYFGTLISAQTFWDPEKYLRLPQGSRTRNYDGDSFYGTDALTDHAMDFLEDARTTPDQPWFLYLAYHAPHFPLHARPDDIAKYRNRYTAGWDFLRQERLARMKQLRLVARDTRLSPRSKFTNHGETVNAENPPWDSLPKDRRADLAMRMAIYAAMVDRMDQNIGRVVADLRARGELDNTLIMFLSDNGACAEWDPFGFDVSSSPNNVLHRGDELERMGSRGTYHSVGSGWANASNTPWRMYKHYSHEGGISTPCIVHWPAGFRRRNVIESAPAHLIDLMPTIVEASGARYPERIDTRQILPMAGTSLVPALRGERMPERTLYFEHEGTRAVREGRYKLTALRGDTWKLYDMERDRTELENLAEMQPRRVESLAKKWDAWAAENQVTPLPANYPVQYLRQN
ncbi:MAG TPA: arylsulfatase [Steroidobacteraceae bacterium]|nr:arylsulfatase [Steroidobacteraceae bacterium]